MRAYHWRRAAAAVRYQHELLACCVLAMAGCSHMHQSINQLHFLSLGLIRGVNRQYICSVFSAKAYGDVTDFACVHGPIQPRSHTTHATISFLSGTNRGTPLKCLSSSHTGLCTAQAFAGCQ